MKLCINNNICNIFKYPRIEICGTPSLLRTQLQNKNNFRRHLYTYIYSTNRIYHYYYSHHIRYIMYWTTIYIYTYIYQHIAERNSLSTYMPTRRHVYIGPVRACYQSTRRPQPPLIVFVLDFVITRADEIRI